MEAILPDTETQNSSCLQFTQAQLCRLCLNQSSNCILIYSDNIATLVTYLPVYVTESDNALLSPWVCIFCVDKMRMVMEFFRISDGNCIFGITWKAQALGWFQHCDQTAEVCSVHSQTYVSTFVAVGCMDQEGS